MKLPQSSTKPNLDTLKNIPLFSGLNPGEVETIAGQASWRQVAAGAFIYQEGDPAERVYALAAGRVRLVQVTVEGQQIIHHMVTPVETFGVISVLAEEDFPVSAQALEDCTILSWDRAAMNDLMGRFPQLWRNAIKIISIRLRESQDRLREMATERVERRLARALLRLVRQAGRKVPEGVLIDLPLSRQDLAEMTGTTLFTVSRTLSQWETQGIIRSGRERVVVVFPHGLVQIAEDLPDPRGVKAG